MKKQGHQAVQDKIGVDATGEVFNSITAVERMRGKEINPLVNPGAIASTSLVSGKDAAAKWKNILQIHSDFAGRQLELNEPVYISEAGDNLRNQAIAHLLYAYGRMYFDPVESTDVYTKQCAINVSAKDAGIMAATLANGGFNPVTKKTVVSPETVEFVLFRLWLQQDFMMMQVSGFTMQASPQRVELAAVLIAVVPGKFGIAVISPPLDKAGNSVKGQLAIKYVIEQLKANPYLIQPKL